MAGDDVWTVKAALDWTRDFLAKKGDGSPRRSAEWLVSAATGLSRVEVYAFHDRPLSLEERARLREAVRRRGAGEPLQYVTGEVAFRHLVVKVRPGVLIPRPETEVLVDAALRAVDGAVASRGEALVADICTGSGCIALSVACERPSASVFATDISPDAVTLASENAERLGLAERVRVLGGDLLSELPAELLGCFDVVVSNPPYVPTPDLASLPAEVADFEPRLALDGGEDGLAIYRRILADARQWLRPGGLLAVELDVSRVKSAASEAGKWYEGVEIVSDLTGRDRIVTARVG
ncbi:MAG: peptide chain release factor N(5)-glutamine methyltransferase [Coriobacteriia bacterium]